MLFGKHGPAWYLHGIGVEGLLQQRSGVAEGWVGSIVQALVRCQCRVDGSGGERCGTDGCGAGEQSGEGRRKEGAAVEC